MHRTWPIACCCSFGEEGTPLGGGADRKRAGGAGEGAYTGALAAAWAPPGPKWRKPRPISHPSAEARRGVLQQGKQYVRPDLEVVCEDGLLAVQELRPWRLELCRDYAGAARIPKNRRPAPETGGMRARRLLAVGSAASPATQVARLWCSGRGLVFKQRALKR